LLRTTSYNHFAPKIVLHNQEQTGHSGIWECPVGRSR